jgi:hypothetical protein
MLLRQAPRRAAVALALGGALLSIPAVAQTTRERVTPANDQALRRQAAAELQKMGVEIDWRIATRAELQDWVMRATEARTLRDRCNMTMDWRTYPLSDLRDWSARCQRAAALSKVGINVDWKVYTLKQLDDLRAAVTQIRTPQKPAAEPGADPDGIIAPSMLERGEAAGAAAAPAPATRKGGKGAAAAAATPPAAPAELPPPHRPNPFAATPRPSAPTPAAAPRG